MQQMFGKIGQNFQMKDRVVIGNTTQEGLDGATGIIGGVSFEGYGASFYIVLLDEPLPYNGWLAISMTEACLARLPDHKISNGLWKNLRKNRDDATGSERSGNDHYFF